MTTNSKPAPQKRRPAKLGGPAKFLMSALSLSAFVGGWSLIARRQTQTGGAAAVTPTVPSTPTATAAPAAILPTATPWPTIQPLPALPPIPTVAPLNPARFAAVESASPGEQTAGAPAVAALAPPLELVPVPTLAPLPAMPAPPPAPPPPPARSGGGGGGGGGNISKGS